MEADDGGETGFLLPKWLLIRKAHFDDVTEVE